MKRFLLLVASIAAGAALMATIPAAPPLMAQRPAPTPNVELLKRYGTRLALPIAAAPDRRATTGVLDVTNAGWSATHVLVVTLGALPAGGCPTRGATPIVSVTCQNNLAPLALTELASGGAGTDSILVYSLDATKAADACAAFAAVKDGHETLSQWEQSQWVPGEPLAVVSQATTGNAATAFAGEPSLSVAGVGAGGGRAGRPGGVVLPALWPNAEGGRARIMNVGTDCVTVNGRLGSGATDQCTPPTMLTAQVPPLGAGDVAIPGLGGAPAGLMANSPGEVVAAFDRLDAAGWVGYSGAVASAEAGGVDFPLAIGPLPNTQADLYMTNQAVTATAHIELVMFDGNQSVHKLYMDPTPLCAGGSRHYDITALAGVVPPTTGGRMGAAGPPMLALRLQGTSPDLPQAPLLSGVMVIKNGTGVTAYGGLAAGAGAAALQGLKRQQQQLGLWTVVPAVKRNVGPHRTTTVLAVQTLGNPQADNGAYLDIYDATGKAVATEVRVPLGDGPAGYVDFASPRLKLPDGFTGSAVLRGVQNRGAMAVVAMERPSDVVAGADALVTYQGVLLPRWSDPNAPTPTIAPTRDPSLPTPTRRPTPDPNGTATPTSVASAVPTATATPFVTLPPAHLFLPYGESNRPDHSAAAFTTLRHAGP